MATIASAVNRFSLGVGARPGSAVVLSFQSGSMHVPAAAIVLRNAQWFPIATIAAPAVAGAAARRLRGFVMSAESPPLVTTAPAPVMMVIDEVDRTPPAIRPADPAVDRARALVADRRRRADYFPGGALNFREPAWDLLLDIYIAEAEGRAPLFETLCQGARIDPATAIRWITTLESIALVEAVRGAPPAPPTLRLAERGKAAMIAYLMAD